MVPESALLPTKKKMSATAPAARKKKATRETCTGGRWTQEEHDLFIKGMGIYGRRWTKVADIVGTRTTVQVRGIIPGGYLVLLAYLRWFAS